MFNFKKLKLFYVIISSFLIRVFLFNTIYAAAIDPGPNPGGIPTDLKAMISKIGNIALSIVGGVAVLVLIIGGFQYITAAGNPDQVGKAKNTIMYAIIGLVICILSYAIVRFVVQAF